MGSMFGPWFVIQYFTSVSFCNRLDWEERAGCFALTVSALWLFLAVPWVGMLCVVVVFPDHTP